MISSNCCPVEFEIVTYVSQGFVKALEFSLPSWAANAGASRILVYSDFPIQENVGIQENRHFFLERSDDPKISWRRKITSLTNAYARCSTPFFCWLDADVYCRASFMEVFGRMGTADIGATRMFNRSIRGYGAINAGVLFFQKLQTLSGFFTEWAELTDKLKGEKWAEQTAASRLIHEAYHGLRPYYATPLSENLYNLEDDSNSTWLKRIEQYKPKLIHFKGGRWQREKEKAACAALFP